MHVHWGGSEVIRGPTPNVFSSAQNALISAVVKLKLFELLWFGDFALNSAGKANIQL